MKKIISSLTCVFFLACQHSTSIAIQGTWRLVSATNISKGVPTVTDFTGNTRMIKIINNSHFAFLRHDINLPKDSANKFDAGGGSYTLKGDQYTEHLDYHANRNWEGHVFSFTVSMHGDTLVQRGLEQNEKEGVDREIIERYVPAN